MREIKIRDTQTFRRLVLLFFYWNWKWKCLPKCAVKFFQLTRFSIGRWFSENFRVYYNTTGFFFLIEERGAIFKISSNNSIFSAHMRMSWGFSELIYDSLKLFKLVCDFLNFPGPIKALQDMIKAFQNFYSYLRRA